MCVTYLHYILQGGSIYWKVFLLIRILLETLESISLGKNLMEVRSSKSTDIYKQMSGYWHVQTDVRVLTRTNRCPGTSTRTSVCTCQYMDICLYVSVPGHLFLFVSVPGHLFVRVSTRTLFLFVSVPGHLFVRVSTRTSVCTCQYPDICLYLSTNTHFCNARSGFFLLVIHQIYFGS